APRNRDRLPRDREAALVGQGLAPGARKEPRERDRRHADLELALVHQERVFVLPRVQEVVRLDGVETSPEELLLSDPEVERLSPVIDVRFLELQRRREVLERMSEVEDAGVRVLRRPAPESDRGDAPAEPAADALLRVEVDP